MRFLKRGNGQRGTIVFAHGAGAPMDSDWMNDVCNRLAKREIQTLRFEFPYMKERRASGKKRPPDRTPILEKTWMDAMLKMKRQPFFVMGKSMGSRIATHIVNDTSALGLIALGFPFHAPRKELSERHAALLATQVPTLILQGERDTLGNKDTLKPLKLKKHQKLVWLPDGDHSLKPRKSSGFTLEQHLETACEKISHFVETHS